MIAFQQHDLKMWAEELKANREERSLPHEGTTAKR